MSTNDEQEKENTPWREQFVFLGFSTTGGRVAAELTRGASVWRIPIHLRPGQEPTEDILLAAIAEGVQQLDTDRLAYKDFEDKYANKVITLPEVEKAE